MKIKEDIFYTESHEWVQFTDCGTARVGISDNLQSKLGKISFVNLCGEGEVFLAGDVIGDVEAFKGVAEIFAPVSGRILRVNEDVICSPHSINVNPYGAWLAEFEDYSADDSLMDEAEYAAFVANI